MMDIRRDDFSGPEIRDLLAEHLLPEIGPAIDHIRIIIPMHPDRYTQTLVPGVAAMAYRVAAAYYRYALGGSGA